MTRFGALRLQYAIRTGELDREDPWLKAKRGTVDDDEETEEHRPSGLDDCDFEVAVALLKSYDSDVREETADLLAESKDARALQPLASLLRDPEPSVREGGIRALAKLEQREVAPAMVPLLRDTNPQVRRAAADALDDLDARGFLPDLVAVFEDEYDENVRWMLFHVISGWDDGRYADLILTALNDENPEIRELAVKHFTRATEPRAIPTLLAQLGSETNEFRLSAIIGALQNAGDPSVASAIGRFRRHESKWVRRAAEEALAWFGVQAEPAHEVTVGTDVYERLSKYPFFRAWKEGRLSKELFLENMDAFRSDFFHEEGIAPEQFQKIIDLELRGRAGDENEGKA